jgi:hypothetical protein
MQKAMNIAKEIEELEEGTVNRGSHSEDTNSKQGYFQYTTEALPHSLLL